MYTLVSTLSRRKEGFAHIFIIDFGHCSSQIHAGFFKFFFAVILLRNYQVSFRFQYIQNVALCGLRMS